MNKPLMGAFLVALIVGALSLAGTTYFSFAQLPSKSWSHQIVNTTTEISIQFSLAVDSYGNPHIAYANIHHDFWGMQGNLIYASYNGSTWIKETPPVNASASEISLAFDTNDTPHIAFVGSPYKGAMDIMFARLVGSEWTTETVDEGGSPTLVLDSNGNPHIIYMAPYSPFTNNRTLKYAVNIGSNWQTQTIIESENISKVSIAVDSYNNPHIIYLYNYKDLKYTHYTGSTWTTETVYSSNDESNVYYASFVLDNNNKPHICFSDSQYHTINYVYWNNSSWAIDVVGTSNNLSFPAPIAVDSQGSPHIAYAADSAIYSRYLAYASRTADRWTVQTVNGIDTSVYNPYLVLDSNNMPHVCYTQYKSTGQYLMYATTSSFTPKPTPTTTPASTSTPTSSPTPSPTPVPTPIATPTPPTPTSTPTPTPTSTPVFYTTYNVAGPSVPISGIVNGDLSQSDGTSWGKLSWVIQGRAAANENSIRLYQHPTSRSFMAQDIMVGEDQGVAFTIKIIGGVRLEVNLDNFMICYGDFRDGLNETRINVPFGNIYTGSRQLSIEVLQGPNTSYDNNYAIISNVTLVQYDVDATPTPSPTQTPLTQTAMPTNTPSPTASHSPIPTTEPTATTQPTTSPTLPPSQEPTTSPEQTQMLSLPQEAIYGAVAAVIAIIAVAVALALRKRK